MDDTTELDTPRFPVRLVALRTGLTAHVLRAWERRYGVVTPTRSEGGQRLYSHLDIERLRRLRRLTDRGHAIGRIASLTLAALTQLDEESTEEQVKAGTPAGSETGPNPAEQVRAETIREFTLAALRATRRLDSTDLQATLERAAVTLGVPDFLEGVVATALEGIGHGWVEKSVTVAQEHMATTVFRRTLGWLLRVYEVSGPAPRVVVATPPGQVHELGALMVAVSAAAEGWAVTYLGPDLPVADLLSAARQTEARAVAISVVYLSDDRDFLAALRETRAGLPERVPLLVGGAAAPELRLEAENAGAVVIDSLADLRALLQRLAAEAVP
ncbi:MAG: cobalamin B12-binding domain-containing protein [Gemmatimonadota bacterium]|nr:cobalamin B12-binding domain-containing protein [Gemmatimonadota bacterium]